MLLNIKIDKIIKLYAYKYKYLGFIVFYMQLNIKTNYWQQLYSITYDCSFVIIVVLISWGAAVASKLLKMSVLSEVIYL